VVNAKDVSDIMKALAESGFEDAEIRLDELYIRVSSQPLDGAGRADARDGSPAPGRAGPDRGRPAAPPSRSVPDPGGPDRLEPVRSPTLGTFYRSPSPGAPPFVNVGDRVEAGQALGIVEVMKLFNTIESEVAGTVAEIHVPDATLVEHDQPLMTLRVD